MQINSIQAHSSRQLSVIGITGTNGKTSCAHMIVSVANKIGMCGSVIGTLGYGIYDGSNYEMTRTGFTTPDAIKIQECLLSASVGEFPLICTAEVSSHALSLKSLTQLILMLLSLQIYLGITWIFIKRWPITLRPNVNFSVYQILRLQ